MFFHLADKCVVIATGWKLQLDKFRLEERAVFEKNEGN